MTGMTRFQASPVRITTAIRAGLTLMAHKEDTNAAHRFATSLDGRSMEGHFCLFEQEMAKRENTTLESLLTVLCDNDHLARWPTNTLGHHYARYIIANDLNLGEFIDQCITTHQDCDASDGVSPQQRQWFMMNNICHDLFHVVGGYGIDALGELCMQAFFSGQSGSRAARLLAGFGSLTAQVVAPRTPVMKMVRRAYRNGGQAAVFALADWTDLLPRPIADVRRVLKVEVNPLYEAVPPVVRDAILASHSA